MRTTVLLLCILLLASSCWARGEYRGRELAVRGMKMVAREGATQAQKDCGWDLVAQGLGVLLSLPDKWEEDEGTLTADIDWFLDMCGQAASLSVDYQISLGSRLTDVQCDEWGARDAVLVSIDYTQAALRLGLPIAPATRMLIAKRGDKMIASSVRGLKAPDDDDLAFLWQGWVEAWGAWVFGGRVWAVLAGHGRHDLCRARYPLAVLLRSEGNTWRTTDRVELGGWHRDGFKLDDVNDDGIPEIVGHFATADVQPFVEEHTDYLIYKLVGNSYVKVWHADLATLPAVLTRFGEALAHGDEATARSLATSPSVVKQAKALGLGPDWAAGLRWYVWHLYDNVPDPYAIATIGEDTHRIDLVKLSKWRWRISGITRCEE